MVSYDTETRKDAALCSGSRTVLRVSGRRRSEPEARTRDDVKRLTLDLSREEHRALKLISVERDVPMAELLRGAIAELQRDDDLLDRVSRHAS